MTDSRLYDDIAPLRDDEVNQTIMELLEDEGFKVAVMYMMPGIDWDMFCAQMSQFTTKYEFQKNLIYRVVWGVARKTSSSIEATNWGNIDRSKQHLFLSNHRDIVLDAGLLNILRFEEGFDTTEIGIGDNLFVFPWIKKLVRLNKSFIVQRGVSVRQMLQVSRHMSEYIHYVINEKNESVWLAHREGRAKDSDDKTQGSLLKMLALAPEGASFIDSLKDLNIIPLSLSYEYDPCDYLKAQEFQLKRDNPEYKKTQKDDLINMEKGILGFKGHIHFQFGKAINDELDKIAAEPDRKHQVELATRCIDSEIHRNYRIYPINYIAYDLLYRNNEFTEQYTPQQVDDFKEYVNNQIAKIHLENKDHDFLWQKFLEMYSNTLKNYLIATGT
ncbi:MULTISPECIES: hypothetical protein [unclassified Dysgonomonas]|uniref:hypothetical protein n=1 Tax=unclassified Dysgonomonas TaxID=2630389 RepID=UPI002473A10F|nr:MULTISPECIES: hypothetical protein [unclassified Dysgonomonas]